MSTLVLLGSGEFTDAMNQTDQFLLEKSSIKKIAVIPAAAGKERDASKWIEMAEDHYKNLGAEVIGIEVYNREDAEDQKWIELIKKADFIYFSGGDPGYLLDVLTGSKLWNAIYELFQNKNIILAGSSAGAMALGSLVLSNPQSLFLLGKPKWSQGLSMTDYLIIPHFNMMGKYLGSSFMKLLLNKAPDDIKNKIMGIDENTALIIEKNEKPIIMGEGEIHLFRDGVESVYKVGNEVVL